MLLVVKNKYNYYQKVKVCVGGGLAQLVATLIRSTTLIYAGPG